MTDLPLISKITLPSGTTYEIKDAWSRERISALGQVMNFLGVTTTDIATNPSTNPISVGGETVTAGVGDVVIYGSKEFVWTGSTWAEFGDLSNINVGKNTSDLVTGTIARKEYNVGSGDANITITATATSAMGTGATFTTTVTPSEKQLKKETINAVSANATNVLKSVTASQVDINTTSEGGEKIVQNVAVAKLGTASFTPKVAGGSASIGTTTIVPAVSGTIALPNNASHVEVGTGLSSGTSVLTGLGTPSTTTLTKTGIVGIDGTETKTATLTLNGTAQSGVGVVTGGTTTNKLVTTTIYGAKTLDVEVPNITGVSKAKLALDTFTPAAVGTAVSVAGTTYATAGVWPTMTQGSDTKAKFSKVAPVYEYVSANEELKVTLVESTGTGAVAANYADAVTSSAAVTYSTASAAFPTLSSTSVTPAVTGSAITYATGGSTTSGTGAEFATGLTAGTAFTGFATVASDATTVATGAVDTNGSGAAVVTGLTTQYLHGSVVVPKADSSVDVASISANADVITSITPTTTKISVANASTTSTSIAVPGDEVSVATIASATNVLTGLSDGTPITYATGGTVATSATGGAQIATGEEIVKYIHVTAAGTSSVDVAVLDGTKSVVTGLEAYSSGDKVLDGITSASTTVSNTAAVNAVADITKITIPAQTFTEQSTGHTHPVSAS